MKNKKLLFVTLLMMPTLMGVTIKEPLQKEYHDITWEILDSKYVEDYIPRYTYEIQINNIGDKYIESTNYLFYDHDKELPLESLGFSYNAYPYFPYANLLGPNQKGVIAVSLREELPENFNITAYAINEENYLTEDFVIENPRIQRRREEELYSYLVVYDKILLPGKANFQLLIDATYMEESLSFYVFYYQNNNDLYFHSTQVLDTSQFVINNVICVLNSYEYIPRDQQEKFDNANTLLTLIFAFIIPIVIALPIIIYALKKKKRAKD